MLVIDLGWLCCTCQHDHPPLALLLRADGAQLLIFGGEGPNVDDAPLAPLADASGAVPCRRQARRYRIASLCSIVCCSCETCSRGHLILTLTFIIGQSYDNVLSLVRADGMWHMRRSEWVQHIAAVALSAGADPSDLTCSDSTFQRLRQGCLYQGLLDSGACTLMHVRL